MSLNFLYIHPANVEVNWPKFWPWIAQAIDDDLKEEDILYIKNACQTGYMHLWGIAHDGKVDMVLVTEAVFYGNKKCLCIKYGAGRIVEEWRQVIEHLEVWARSKGYDHLQVYGRKGWEKLFKPDGYSFQAMIIGKDLTRSLH